MPDRHFVSTPGSLPLHKKENVIPVALLRPVSPTQAQSQVNAQALPSKASQLQPLRSIPKSRTVGMLSNFRSTFRRRSSLTLHIEPRKISTSSTIASVIGSDVDDPNKFTEFCPSRYIWGSHDEAYWSGRFSSIRDSLRNEFLDELVDQDEIPPISISTAYSNPPSSPLVHRVSTRDAATESNQARSIAPAIQSEPKKPTAEDEVLMSKKAFSRLAEYCRDESAQKSLFSYQQNYARIHDKPSLLPEGGRMEPLLSRMGRTLEEMRKNGLDVLGKRRSSVLN